MQLETPTVKSTKLLVNTEPQLKNSRTWRCFISSRGEHCSVIDKPRSTSPPLAAAYMPPSSAQTLMAKNVGTECTHVKTLGQGVAHEGWQEMGPFSANYDSPYETWGPKVDLGPN